jgi:hypothetical protein
MGDNLVPSCLPTPWVAPMIAIPMLAAIKGPPNMNRRTNEKPGNRPGGSQLSPY